MQSNEQKKILALLLLVFQGSAHALLIRYSKTIGATSYIASTTVVVVELYKLFLSLLVVYYRDLADRTPADRFAIILELILGSSRASIPAFLYAIQNNLVFVALANLDAATFQVMYQSKIITTALFLVLLLGKRLNYTQIISLLLLFQGVVLVQTPTCQTGSNAEESQKNVFLGFLVVCAISFTSGLAGALIEKILKSGSGSPFARNVQLAFWGFLFSVVMMLYNDYTDLTTLGFFHGYNLAVWGIINISALGGILIALVVVYTDNIAKGFATSLSIVLSSLISIVFFDFQLTLPFGIGATIVILSVILYSDPDGKLKPSKV